MIPRSHIGKGISGAVRYALGEGRDRATGRPRTEPKGDRSRVEWIGGTGFGFAIDNRDDADLARKVMEFMAANQRSKTKPCEKDCLHLSLGWRQGEQPSREQMEEAARGALAALGMANARAIFVCHNDEQYPHLHIVASKLNPETGRAYDLKGDRLKLSAWAEKYEREFSGGIICTRRAETNQLRSAIDRRDAAAVLALMVQQRATFTARDLDRALGKQIRQPLQRAQFGNDVLALPDVVRLTDPARPEAVRFTTRTVLEAEGQVLRAANMLATANRHAVNADIRRAVLDLPAFAGMSRQQATAFLHSIEAGGLALIDGQAGTGKSYTISAIRQAYERAGYAVIGLGPTNAVASDMRDSGFRHAATIHSELFRLKNGRTAWTDRTALILDEAAMIDTQLMAQVAVRAAEAGAKLIMLGDDRQLSSIDRGGMFGVLNDRHGSAELTQVRRQHKNDDRRASELMAEGNFTTALGMYDAKGAIRWERSQDDAREALIEQWAKDTRADPSKSRFVFAYTNADVSQLNADLRAVRLARGELPGPASRFTTRHGPADFSAGDRIQITGTDKERGLFNGAAGTVTAIDGTTLAFRLDDRDRRVIEFDTRSFQDFRHGYAGTIYKGQGRTLDQTYLYHSEHWRSAASYVALTRHRDKTELFVATNTAADLKTLSRQMARVDDRRAASAFYQQGPIQPVRPAASQDLQPIELSGRQIVGASSVHAGRPVDGAGQGPQPATAIGSADIPRPRPRRDRADVGRDVLPARIAGSAMSQTVTDREQGADALAKPRHRDRAEVSRAAVPEQGSDMAPRPAQSAVIASRTDQAGMVTLPHLTPPAASPIERHGGRRDRAEVGRGEPQTTRQKPISIVIDAPPAHERVAAPPIAASVRQEPPPAPMQLRADHDAPLPAVRPEAPASPASVGPIAPPAALKPRISIRADSSPQATAAPAAPEAHQTVFGSEATHVPVEAPNSHGGPPAEAERGLPMTALPVVAREVTDRLRVNVRTGSQASASSAPPEVRQAQHRDDRTDRKQDQPTPLSEITDKALLRVVIRDFGSRRPDEQESENKPNSVHTVWQWRPRPR